MTDLLRKALVKTCNRFQEDVKKVALGYWNESVFRFYLIQDILALNSSTEVWSEWHRVDLVLSYLSRVTIVELKFFTRNELYDLSGKFIRWKGGPSKKADDEFTYTVDKLTSCRQQSWASGHPNIDSARLILVYFDRMDSKGTYHSRYEGQLSSDKRILKVDTIVEAIPIPKDALFTCKLLTIKLNPK
jgi:hypothetical protein